MRNQLYAYTAKREWFNSETYSFNAGTGLVDRDRFFVAHDQKLNGNKAELQWDAKLAGMDNRMVAAFEVSKLDFVRPSDFHGDGSVTLVDPVRGTFGTLTLAQQTARIGNTALTVEDRLKVTPAFALIGGLRYEEIDLDRTSTNKTGAIRRRFPVFQVLAAHHRPRRIYLGNHARIQPLRPVRDRRRRRGQQPVFAGRHCSRWI